MNETAPEPTVAAAAVLAPLSANVLPASVQKLVQAPVPAKLMVAKGIAPLKPVELAIALYQLSFDVDEGVKAAAEGAPAALPDKIVVPPLAEPLPASVLHFFASRLQVTRIEAFEKILYNQSTGDVTFVLLAGRLAERELEIIFQNEARLLRCPVIVQTLYFNKHARMSSLNRAIELCARNNVRVDGIPAFDEVAKSIAADTSATDPVVVDSNFEQVVAAAAAAASGDDKDDEDDDPKRKSPIIDFTKLKLYEKIRLATLGNAYCRQNLIRDANRLVAMAVIRSQGITDSEVVRAASNRSVCEDVIRYIANKRDWMKMYQVKLSLANNPKCPLAFSLRILPMLHADDLKTLARSKNVPSAISTAARKLSAARRGPSD